MVVLIKELPVLATGKINYSQLIEMAKKAMDKK